MTKAFIRKPGDTAWSPATINSYSDINAAVGGYIESAPIAPSKFTLYINEEGKLKSLPPNAFWLYEGEAWDVIVGTMVLMGPPDGEGEDTDATVDMTELADSNLKYI